MYGSACYRIITAVLGPLTSPVPNPAAVNYLTSFGKFLYQKEKSSKTTPTTPYLPILDM